MPHSFDPASEDVRAFRDALGQFGTGVTVVTCATPAGPMGITANSFTSVSLDPPMVLWCPAKRSTRYPFFMAARHFAIHVMAKAQHDLCRGFARSGNAFDLGTWGISELGVPLIEGCLSRFECETTASHDAGDHSVVLARVTRVTTNPGAPLMFFGSCYGEFSEDT